jgi:hypothetical protein
MSISFVVGFSLLYDKQIFAFTMIFFYSPTRLSEVSLYSCEGRCTMADKTKEKKSKLSEAEKREKVALALAKKKQMERRALEIVHRETATWLHASLSVRVFDRSKSRVCSPRG